MRQDYQQLQTQAVQSDTKLEQERAKNQQLGRENEELKVQNQHLDAKYDQLVEQNFRMMGRHIAVSYRNGSLVADRRDLIEENDDWAKISKDQKRELAASEKTRKDQTNTIHQLRGQISDLKTTVTSKKQALEASQAESVSLKTQVAEGAAREAALEVRITILQAEKQDEVVSVSSPQ